jgi:hypothetical protein
MLGETDGSRRRLVRYEDMASDLSSVARDLGEWLAVSLASATSLERDDHAAGGVAVGHGGDGGG